MLTDDEPVLTSGKSWLENKERFLRIHVVDYRKGSMITFGPLGITEYDFDCGSVLFHFCCQASDKNITDAIDFCSFNGFDKIFHTHTNSNIEWFKKFKERMTFLGFHYIPAGHSNRNPEYFCGIFAYHIPKCESTGYNF